MPDERSQTKKCIKDYLKKVEDAEAATSSKVNQSPVVIPAIFSSRAVPSSHAVPSSSRPTPLNRNQKKLMAVSTKMTKISSMFAPVAPKLVSILPVVPSPSTSSASISASSSAPSSSNLPSVTLKNAMTDRVPKRKYNDDDDHSISSRMKSDIPAEWIVTNNCQKNGRWHCPVLDCDKSFCQKQHLTRHIKGDHMKARTSKCPWPTCGKILSDKDHMKIHYNSIHLNLKEICKICNIALSSPTVLATHMKEIHGENPRIHVCLECDYSSNRKRHLVDHINAVHKHEKFYVCSLCTVSFAMKQKLNDHIASVHDRKKNHKCGDCGFEFFALQTLKKHTKSKFCIDCMISFECSTRRHEHISLHGYKCGDCLKVESDVFKVRRHCINRCREPAARPVKTLKIAVKSIFTDEEGRITELIPGFPMQGTCSLSIAKNTTEKLQFHGISPIFLNQHQNLIQNGSSALLLWCSTLNSLASCTEVIAWERDENGKIKERPSFSREGMLFKKDENDKLFNIPTTTLSHPWQMGHARAAGNCWSEVDFRASFSSLNFWPQHRNLNTIHWKRLEDHIRSEARRFVTVFITTGAIFTDPKGKIVANYVSDVLIPFAFYKLAFFERDDGFLEFRCWLMENSGEPQPHNRCQVSLIELEAKTRCFFVNPMLMKRLDPASVDEHLVPCKQTSTR